MADNSVPAVTTATPTSPRGRQNAGRGRGRGQSNSQNQPRGGGFRGRQANVGRQRGGRARDNHYMRGHRGLSEPVEAVNPGGGQPPGGSVGDRLTDAASKIDGEPKLKAPANTAPSEAGDVCFICASEITHSSVAPCNHQTCHVCALRWRALFKDRHCVVCRAPADFVVFTDDSTKRFEEFKDSEVAKSDENLGIKFETATIYHDTCFLLQYNCPVTDCDAACRAWPDLHRHVKLKHGRVMCDLCTRNKKAFTHEHQLFTFGELRKHERFGDDNPGAVDQSGFKGHPECGFCRQRFYGDDELFSHCREKHEKCFLCERRNGGRQPVYYHNYEDLERHFGKDHLPCLDPECQTEKFVVFDSEMDLKAHQLSRHANGLSKDVRRDARVVDMSGFEYRDPYQPQRGSRRGPGGRGQDPNAEPLPMSSAQPLSRAEQAYQRTMAIQSAQSVSTRTFGGQLTQPTRPTPAPQPATELPAVNNLTLDSSPPTSITSLNPQERARQLQHQSVIDRASRLFHNDTAKLDEFRGKVSFYRTGKITAPNLIDAFFSLFDTNSAELGKLIKELADIYEDESQREGLLKAWNDWRAINEDYPSLPGPSGVLPGLSSTTVGGVSGKRVLKLKSSTAKSSQSAVNRQGSWGTAGASAAGSAFPPLSGPDGAQKRPNPTAWVTTSASTSTRSSSTSAAIAVKPTTSSARNNEEAFPALPAGAKVDTLMAGLTRGNVRWNNAKQKPLAGSNPWGAGGGAANANGNANANATSAIAAAARDANEGAGAGAGAGAGKKKGNNKKGKGKGEVLYHFG